MGDSVERDFVMGDSVVRDFVMGDFVTGILSFSIFGTHKIWGILSWGILSQVNFSQGDFVTGDFVIGDFDMGDFDPVPAPVYLTLRGNITQLKFETRFIEQNKLNLLHN